MINFYARLWQLPPVGCRFLTNKQSPINGGFTLFEEIAHGLRPSELRTNDEGRLLPKSKHRAVVARLILCSGSDLLQKHVA